MKPGVGRAQRFERRLDRLSVTIVGAGRVGSFAALVAGMAGVRHIRVYDHDRLDPDQNVAVQLYRISDLRAKRPKVEALRDLLNELVPSVHLVPCAERFEGLRRQATDPVVVLAVDSMATSASLIERLASRRGAALLLDIRIGGSVMQCLSVRDRDDLLWYQSALYDDSQAWGGTCADSPEPQVAVGAAAFLAGALMAHLRGREFPRRIVVDFDSGAVVVERRGDRAGARDPSTCGFPSGPAGRRSPGRPP